MYKKIFLFLLAVLILGAISRLFFVSSSKTKISNNNRKDTTESQIARTVSPVDPIKEIVSKMSLDEKIGQLLIIGFEHSYVDDHIRTMITKYHIGGINLLGRNITSRAQTIKLMTNLQVLASTTLFLATDQEGGKVSRFTFSKELTSEPKIKIPDQAFNVALTRGQELKELGVNMNFAPVLDYVSDPKSYLYGRTFATTSDIIGELGTSMIEGYKEAGIISVAKHFPGYGNIKPDPHKNAAIVDVSQLEFEEFLTPFKVAITNGNVDAIMTAHIIIPSIDNKPATMSPKILTEILRGQLGFKGVIITDDLEMASAGSSVEKIALDSIMAGADMVISTYTTGKHIPIFNYLKKAVENGEISQERLDVSVYRILLLKKSLMK